MSAFRARPGYKLVQADAVSLEPVVLAQFSNDATLMGLYRPGAPETDIYLHLAANIAALASNVRKHFDPDNPTPEGIAAAKKHCKQDRSVAKGVHLACLPAGTLVRVRDGGYVPIESVTPQHEVWDGTAWVRTDGAVYRGRRVCIEHDGVSATADHHFLTTEGWREFDQIQKGADGAQCVRPEQPGASWADVWSLGRQIIRSAAAGVLSLCAGLVSAR
jgi:hypothetical protein